MSIDATIAITVDWLCKHQPVVFTGRTKDQPLMAQPFELFQACVRANQAFFKVEHGCNPNPNSKTGLAGVRSRAWTKVFRDHVLLPALRVYRSRTEGASLDTVPEVTYAQKPSCDGRSDKSVAQRGILGFEPSAAHREYIYNPDRNPNLMDMPAEPPDRETCAWDKEADLRNVTLESEYYMVLEVYPEALDTTVTTAISPATKTLKRKQYMCSHCRVPKKGHVCPNATQSKKRKDTSVRSSVKRARHV